MSFRLRLTSSFIKCFHRLCLFVSNKLTGLSILVMRYCTFLSTIHWFSCGPCITLFDLVSRKLCDTTQFLTLRMTGFIDRLCGLVVRVPSYRTEVYCVSCEVRTEFICYLEESRPPLWFSGQSSWLHIQRSGFYSRRCQIFWGVVGLEPGPLSLVSTIEDLLGKKSSGFGLESREYGRTDSSRSPRGSLYP
jgi:hypothetical protein